MHAEPEDSPGHEIERFDAEGRVEHCCDQDRPGPGPRIEFVADSGFVTIGRFIEVEHSWLWILDDQLRAAQGVCICSPLDSAVDMYVRPGVLSPIEICGGEAKRKENLDDEWAQLAEMIFKMEHNLYKTMT